MRQYQFVTWFPRWVGLGFTRLDSAHESWGFIYRWGLRLGFWELRRWAKLPRGR